MKVLDVSQGQENTTASSSCLYLVMIFAAILLSKTKKPQASENQNRLPCTSSTSFVISGKEPQAKYVFLQRSAGFWQAFSDARHLSQLAADHRVDVIHLHGLWNRFNHSAARFARRQAIPLVITPRGMLEPWCLQQKRLKKQLALWLYQRKDLRLADVLHATSEQGFGRKKVHLGVSGQTNAGGLCSDTQWQNRRFGAILLGDRLFQPSSFPEIMGGCSAFV